MSWAVLLHRGARARTRASKQASVTTQITVHQQKNHSEVRPIEGLRIDLWCLGFCDSLGSFGLISFRRFGILGLFNINIHVVTFLLIVEVIHWPLLLVWLWDWAFT